MSPNAAKNVLISMLIQLLQTSTRCTASCLSVFVLLQLSACHNEPSAQQTKLQHSAPVVTAKAFDFEKNMGWAHGNCLAIKNSTLRKGTLVALVSLDGKQAISTAQIDASVRVESNCPALSENRAQPNKTDGRVFYQLNFPQSGADQLAIAILADSLPMHSDRMIFNKDLDGDGIIEVVNTCDTSEGIEFSLWSGAVNTGKLLWSDYYYLGYDLQPTCH